MNKKHNNLKQYFNKGISTPTGILIVLLVAAAAGVLAWQFWPEEEVFSPAPTSSPKSTTTPSPSSTTTEPYIEVISPNGGEVWEIGSTYQIKWDSSHPSVKEVKIALQDTRYDPFSESPLGEVVIASLQDTGSYSWTIPSQLVDGLGRIMELGAGNVYKIVVYLERPGGKCFVEKCDVSNNYFNIAEKDETADWEVYTNQELGYEIKYPQKADKESDTPFKLVLSEISQWTLDLEIKKLASSSKEMVQDCFYIPLGQTIKEETLTVNDIDFCLNIEEDSGTGGQTRRDYYYLTEKDGEYILLDFMIIYNRYCGESPEYACEPFDEENDTKVFDQMLSTFKFID